MGQKANPNDLRNGITFTSPSKWYARKRDFAKYLIQDNEIREYLTKKYKEAGISRIEIERDGTHVTLTINSSKPGIIIGRSGGGIDELRKELYRKFGIHFEITVRDPKNADLDAAILAHDVARQIENRIAFRRAGKSVIRRAMEGGAQGIKVAIGGRLGGADISRTEFFTEGKIPLHTLRAKISYAMERAETTYGTIGIKVWVYTGESFRAESMDKSNKTAVADISEV